jgi:UDP-3-O-[3-hydroxymyristoyl] glucosamine N-acyltransferase
VPVTVRQLAEWAHGQVDGDGDLVIVAARPLAEARPGDVTFAESDRHLAALATCPASAAVVHASAAATGKALIRVADPMAAFCELVRRLHGRPERPPQGVHPFALVHPSVRLGEQPDVGAFATLDEGTVVGARCRLGPGVRIGRDCRLGDDVVLHANVVLYDGTVLGDRVIVHANSVLGSDGYGYRFQQGRQVKVPQLGWLEVGDDVEIGAGTTIDRGTFQATVIGPGTKIDNLVQIGHNCRIGRHNLIIAQVGVGGSSVSGDYVIMAGQAGITDHVSIGDRSVVGAQAGVTKNVPPGIRLWGTPAIEESLVKRIFACWEKLPEMRRDLRRLLKENDPNPDADAA